MRHSTGRDAGERAGDGARWRGGHQTKNAQGAQYTFDKGFTGFGTGVGCPSIGSERRLAGYEANSTGSTLTVTRTLIRLNSSGTRASNGTRTTLGTKLSASDGTVKTAQGVACGSGGTAHEG